MSKLLLIIALTITLTGCLPEDFGGSFTIVNDSQQTVYYGTVPIPPDGQYVYDSGGCLDPGLELHDRAGAIVVRVEEEVCDGQMLTVRGPDDYTLESTSG